MNHPILNLPEEFIHDMQSLLGHEWSGFWEAMAAGRPPWNGLRANTLKISPEELPALLPGGLRLERVPWSWGSSGFYCSNDEDIRVSKLPYHDGGLYYMQEPSAMSAASMLPINLGDRVLDLCAAPGGKSTQLAAKLAGSGVLVSNEISGSRCLALISNLERLGVRNAVVTNERPDKLLQNLTGWFDKVLIDAPCSGEGMFRREPETVRGYLEHPPDLCAALQKRILDDGARLLTPGGMLLYSTCTFNPDENERNIQWFLDSHPDFAVCPIDHKQFGLSPGRADWAGGDQRLLGCARIWPHIQRGEGHFVALLQREGQLPEKPRFQRQNEKIPGLEAYHDFCRAVLQKAPDGRLALRKNALYLEPCDMPDLTGIRAPRTGLYLGDLKPGRFEPSQALALALRKEDVAFTLDFSRDGEDLRRYLAGESFHIDTQASGYHLVCVDGYPLGFVKVAAGRLKNRPR